MVRDKNGEMIEWGVATRAMEGERATGDRYVVKRYSEGVLFAVIDGLGHGEDAAHAARVAAEEVSGYPSNDIIDLIESCHRRLRGFRGVVMTVILLTFATEMAHGIAVGNVQAMLARTGARRTEPEKEFVILRGGVVGHILPPLRPSAMKLDGGDTLILATDGISFEFTLETRFDEPPQALADRILAKHAIQTDDALVLVARYLGA